LELSTVSRSEVRFSETRKVAIVGAVVNLVLAILKTVIGFAAQSQALIADGVHSLSDLLSDGLVYVAAKQAAQGPDSDHPYGHGRYETAGTLGLSILLFLAAGGIVWDAAMRLLSSEGAQTPGVIAIYAALFSVLANEGLYQYTARVGRKIESNLLIANAWHHRTDAVSSIVVVIGVGGALAGFPYLDAVAAIAVGLMIAHVGWELGWPALQELVDEGLEESDLDDIKQIINEISGVQGLHMLRTRKMGGRVSTDVHILVDPLISVSEGHMISQTVIDRLIEHVDPIVDVTVHIDPEDDEKGTPSKGLPLRIEAEALLEQAISSLHGYPKHKRIVLHYLAGCIDVDIYFQLEEQSTPELAAKLRAKLQDVVDPLPVFGEIRIYFG